MVFVLLLCACGTKDQPAAPSETPAMISETAQPSEAESPAVREEQNPQGEIMFSSMVYSTLNTEGKTIWIGPEAGIKEFRVPESFTNAKGGIRAYVGFEIEPGTGLTRTDIMYIPSSEEAYDALLDELSAIIAGGLSDEESIKELEEASVKFQNSLAILFTVIGVPNNGGPEIAKESMLNNLIYAWLLTKEEATEQMNTYTFISAGSVKDYNFYLAYSPDSTRNAFDGEKASWKAEFDELQKDVASYVGNFTFERPQGLSEVTESGSEIRFESTDLDGNPVSSAELFSGHKTTMINIWETTCTGCISEMPELNRISKEFESMGGQIIGIVYDAEEADLIEDAKEIVSDLKIEFINILPTEEIKQILVVQSFPTTYFVNEKGELAGLPVVGSQLNAYRSRMNELPGE